MNKTGAAVIEFSLVRKLINFRLCKEMLEFHVASPAGEQYRENVVCGSHQSRDSARKHRFSSDLKQAVVSRDEVRPAELGLDDWKRHGFYSGSSVE